MSKFDIDNAIEQLKREIDLQTLALIRANSKVRNYASENKQLKQEIARLESLHY